MAETVGIAEASQMLKISMDAVYRLVQSGKISATKRRGQWIISRSAIAARIREKASR